MMRPLNVLKGRILYLSSPPSSTGPSSWVWRLSNFSSLIPPPVFIIPFMLPLVQSRYLSYPPSTTHFSPLFITERCFDFKEEFKTKIQVFLFNQNGNMF